LTGHHILADDSSWQATRENRNHAVFVSAASAREFATKYRIEKLPGVAALAADIGTALASQGFIPLPINRPMPDRRRLPGGHRDPFDRSFGVRIFC
jgi:PIN domain nuclease of toxin-antitoxin system